MTRPFSPDLRHALAQTKRLAYGEIKSGEALSAWKAFKDRWAYLRREHGMLVIEAFSLTQAFSMIAATWPAANPANKARRAREEANLSAMIKACLALIEGDIVPPDADAQQRHSSRLGGPSQAIDFKSRAAGERPELADEPGLF
jgi:hypothetical protein